MYIVNGLTLNELLKSSLILQL